MPPAAMIGTPTFAAMSGTSTIVDAPSGFLNPPPSMPSTTKPVDAGLDGLHRAPQRRHDVEDGHAGLLEQRHHLGRIAGARRHEAHAVVDDEIDDRRIADEELRDVDAPRLVGEVAHLLELELDLVELARTPSR